MSIFRNNCCCIQCKNNEFDANEYIVNEEDFKILDKERPIGISGHMRVKDEAISVAECIESCIDFLDELIITYNTSSDDTEIILKKYKDIYPEKIRLYHYKPNIIRCDYNEFNNKYNKVHSLANYYNYGYTKIKYKYYLKIDADQIYFKDKLLNIRKALLMDIKNKYDNTIDKLTKILFFMNHNKIFNKMFARFIKNNFKKIIKKLINFFLNKRLKNISIYDNSDITNFFNVILYNRIVFNDNIKLNMGGLNIIYYNKNFYFNTNIVFNGCVGDHYIWKPISTQCYYMSKTYTYEVISTVGNNIDIGFCWTHIHYMKNISREDFKVKLKDTENLIPFYDIQYIDYNEIENYIEKNIKSKYILDKFKYFGKNFFNQDKKYITKRFYESFLKEPLEYAITKYSYQNDIINVFIKENNKLKYQINNITNNINLMNQDLKIELSNNKNEKKLFKFFGIYNNQNYIYIYLFGIKGSIKATEKNINRIAWWIPVKEWRDNFRSMFAIKDQTRPDQTRPDQTRPDQTRPDQT